MSEPPGDGPLERARRALAGQAKMLAIKRYREEIGCGWAEAAEAVERIRAGRAPAAARHATGAPVGAAARAVGDALAAGKMIEAIRLYRAATGVGLKEAKDAVDAIVAEKKAGGRYQTAIARPATRVVERRRLSPALLLLIVAVLSGTALGLVVLLARG